MASAADRRPQVVFRRWPLLALVSGLAALLAGVTWWLASPTLTGFGTAQPQPPTAQPPIRAAGSSSPGTPSATSTPSATTTAPTPQGDDTTLPGEPIRLMIPTEGVQAAVVPVESHGGVLDVPENINQTGWWAGSALAGATAGSTVLDGHVDSAAGPGALLRLQDLRKGDPLQLDTTSRQLRYTITGRQIISKTGPLPAELFSASGLPRLVLISCGGPFDRATGSYRDNIVIFAVPAP